MTFSIMLFLFYCFLFAFVYMLVGIVLERNGQNYMYSIFHSTGSHDVNFVKVILWPIFLILDLPNVYRAVNMIRVYNYLINKEKEDKQWKELIRTNNK